MISRNYDLLEACTFPTRDELGEAAAEFAAVVINEAIDARGEARVIFACAPSQNEFLAALIAHQDDPIDWSKVTAFHMDDYVGFTASREESFRHYLHTHLLQQLPTRPRFHEIRAETPVLAKECARYTALLTAKPIDLVCLGIGENGHLAFNDPPVADFDDPHCIKVVELDDACRIQQVNDGCFPNFDAVPTHALTLTIPALFSARHVSACVPGPRKAEAVRATLLDPISTACPASILRTHPCATLHLDTASASLL
jgi:glucosamine-6-phosphate deaminase